MTGGRPAGEIAGGAIPIRPRLYSVIVDGRSYEVALDVDTGDPTAAVAGVAYVDGEYVPVRVDDPRRRVARATATTSGGPAAGAVLTVTAPMPGRVVAVPVLAGAAVEQGQTVLVLEAMKMESAITAPHAGTVGEVLVSEGQAVQQRQPLLRIQTA